VWSLSKGVRGHSPTECHRTISAHIRFHLDGGPQGWNPHFSGPACCPEAILKASSSVGELPRRSVWPGFVGPDRAAFAFCPSALLHLRASEFARVEPHDVSDLRVPSERPVILKGVGWVAVRQGKCRPGLLRIRVDGRFTLNPVGPRTLRQAITRVRESHASPRVTIVHRRARAHASERTNWEGLTGRRVRVTRRSSRPRKSPAASGVRFRRDARRLLWRRSPS